jgi:hypothetical protein
MKHEAQMNFLITSAASLNFTEMGLFETGKARFTLSDPILSLLSKSVNFLY